MTAQQLAYLRLLIADTDFVGGYVFTDDELQNFYGNEGESVYRAAARALEVHAVSIAQTIGAVRGLLDIQLGGRESANVLTDAAKRLRASGGRMVSMSMSAFDPSVAVDGWWLA